MAEGRENEHRIFRERLTLAGLVLVGVVVAILAGGYIAYAGYLTYQLMAMAIAAEPFKFWLFKVGLAGVVGIVGSIWVAYRITKAWDYEGRDHSSNAAADDRASFEYDEGSGDSGAVEPALL